MGFSIDHPFSMGFLGFSMGFSIAIGCIPMTHGRFTI